MIINAPIQKLVFTLRDGGHLGFVGQNDVRQQNDVINLVVDLSKRGSSHMTQCVLLQKLSIKLFFKLVRAAILDLALQRKMQGFLGGTCDLYFFPKGSWK